MISLDFGGEHLREYECDVIDLYVYAKALPALASARGLRASELSKLARSLGGPAPAPRAPAFRFRFPSGDK